MKRPLTLIAGSIVGALLFAGGTAAAQGAMKIGYVDLLTALNESAAGKAAQEELKKIVDGKKERLKASKEAINQKKEDLDRQGLLLNEETRAAREEEIRRLERDHTRSVSDTKDELTSIEKKYTDGIRKDLMKVIEEIGSEEGYTMIFEKQYSAILFAPDTADLTAQVIERYDAQQSAPPSGE